LAGNSETDRELSPEVPSLSAAIPALAKLQESFQSVLSMHVRLKAEENSKLEEVTQLWLSLFKQIDASYDSKSSPPEKPLLFDMPQSTSAVASEDSVKQRNDELLRQGANYWHLRAIDLNATAAMRAFVRIHYGDSMKFEKLRQAATSAGLSPVRIQSILSTMNSSADLIPSRNAPSN
jgi:hypothetical protein